MPKQVGFFIFYLAFLWFSWLSFSEIFHILQDTNFQHENAGSIKAVCSIYANYVFYRCGKTGLLDFSEKWALYNIYY